MGHSSVPANRFKAAYQRAGLGAQFHNPKQCYAKVSLLAWLRVARESIPVFTGIPRATYGPEII